MCSVNSFLIDIWIANNMTFELFLEMEYEVRSYMSAENFQRDTAISSIKCSEDILFLWDIIAASWDDDTKSLLLDLIVQLWIKIRGFSYASAWIERFKAIQKKTTQKSKGLRKGLGGTE